MAALTEIPNPPRAVEFDRDLLAKTVQSLTAARLSNLEVLSGTQNGYPGAGEAMLVWLVDNLDHSYFSRDYVDLITQAFGRAIMAYGRKLQLAMSAKETELPVGLLTVLDRRYATVTGALTFLDMVTTKTIAGVKQAPIETVGYNLCQIYNAGLHKYGQQQAAHSHA